MTLSEKFRILSLLFISNLLVFIAFGSQPERQNEKAFRIHDDIYHKNIKTVLLHRPGHELSFPVINFNSGEQLMLSFDDLDGDVKVYKYTIVHCDARWNLSELWPSDYLSGFTDDIIEKYRLSFNTFQPYTHYELVLPNDNIRPMIPGNYLLIVYPDSDPDDVAFTRRFSIVNQKIAIDGRIRMPATSPERTKKQEIAFWINTEQNRIADHSRNLKVVVRQNNRWDNELVLQPYQIRGDVFDYQHIDESNTFYAVNEFRPMDLRSVRFQSGRIQQIEKDRDGYHFFFMPDERRNTKRYIHQQDLNGRFQILAENTNEPTTEAEYVYAYFTLPVEAPIPNANVFITGMLTDWQFRDENKMYFNPRKSAYEARLLLKQGFYNYHYSLLVNGTASGDTGFFEGNFADTGNEYTVFVYYRQPGSRFDALIGIKTFNSRDFL